MKKSRHNHFLIALLALVGAALPSTHAADLFWDGGNIGGTGDGAGTYASGTWSTANANWDQGAGLSRLAWNNANLDTAIFAGTFAAGLRTITIASDITVNQIQVLTGSTGGNRYDIGASATQNDSAITFGGTYTSEFPAITGNASFVNTQFNAKITADLSAAGGLVVKHGSDGTNPTSGRLAFLNFNNDFIGDLVLTGGNLSIATPHQGWGNPANRLNLQGGSLFASGVGVATVDREIVVSAASGINCNATGSLVMDLTGAITGSASLTRYNSGNAGGDVRFSGDLSGFSGMIENTGVGVLTIQSTSQSAGGWIVNGGTLKLNTADDTHIANGAGKANLIINGGTLDMNGKSETINGLSGSTGTVRNNLLDTDSTLTLGDGDASAVFGGTLANGAGTLALTKIGSGSQTIGNATHSGPTLVSAGGLILAGSMPDSTITVATGASLAVTSTGKDLGSLTLENGSTFSAPLGPIGSADYLLVRETLTLGDGGTVTLVPTFADAPETGVHDFVFTNGGISGTSSLVADFSANGPTRVSGTAQSDGFNITLTITTLGANLVWNIGGATSLWSVDGDANFLIGASPGKFLQYDHVTFGPTSTAGTIQLAGTLLPASVTVDSSDNFAFAGTGRLDGSASLTKSGTGTLTIDTSNVNSGNTSVTAGTLAVNGSLGAGDLTVDPGATLTGGGTAAGTALIDGTVAPGTGVGTLSLGTTVLSGTLACDIDGDQADVLAVTGNLTLDDATLPLNLIQPPTRFSYVIATYTGTLIGTFAAVPAGYVVDTSVPGKLLLWQQAATLPPADSITFEQDQGYPTAGSDVSTAPVPNRTTNLPFDGINGWSQSTSSNGSRVHATASSGSYFGGQSFGASGTGTYIGGKNGAIARTGANTLSFDSTGGATLGFFKDGNGNDAFDQTADTGMQFSVGGGAGQFYYRNAGFGTQFNGTGLGGAAGHWFRTLVTIGESIDGSRTISMAIRNLTLDANVDFDPETEGVQPWTFTVTDAQFGTAPELSDGIFVRATGTARIDNIRATSVAPPAGGGYADWALANGITGGIDGDHDNDRVANGIEFFMGESGNGFTAMPELGADRKITCTMGDDYTGAYGPDADYVLESSTTLGGWMPVPAGQVQFLGKDVSYTLPAGEDRIFVRLKVLGPQ